MPPPAASTDARDAPGWYGKLASLGDFAQRRLPSPWLATCDAWLSSAMRIGQERLGERWLDVYLTAPVLRFAWAPGVVDAQWWFGLLMPSCDSVGRYFPLLIAQARARAPEDRVALDHLELWFEHLARAAVRTLDNDAQSVDELELALQETPPWPTAGARGALAARSGAQGQHLRTERAEPLSQWLHALAAQELLARLAGHTLWWRTAVDGDDDRVDILQGLPNGPAFAALLQGIDPPA